MIIGKCAELAKKERSSMNIYSKTLAGREEEDESSFNDQNEKSIGKISLFFLYTKLISSRL